jgi:large subunit ribosomal protein L10
VLEAGEPVSDDLEGVLSELGIEPKEVGLDLRGVFSEGVRFEPDELAIDVDEYRSDVAAAASAARNLSVNAAFPTTETTPTLLANAAGDAKALGVFAAIEDPEVLPDLIGKADAQVRAVAAEIDDDDALPEELRGVEAPAAPAAEAETDAADADEEPADEDDTDETEADADTDDDDDDGAEGLGAMFG